MTISRYAMCLIKYIVYLSALLLENFRSHQKSVVEFNPKANLILGPNGSGKTNILESIYLLASGRSFRSSSLGKLINWQQHFASVRAKLIHSGNEKEIEVQLINDPQKLSRSTTRKFFIDHVSKIRKNYLGTLSTVVFQPEDIRLVTGSPSRRRELLDDIFVASNWRYAIALSQYNKALKHRNELLDLIQSGKANKSQIFFWDQSLIKNDNILHDFRLSFINHINRFFYSHPNKEIKSLSLNYRPSILNQDKLEKNYLLDLSRGHTQFGCHRDDFSFDSAIFPSADQDLANWGSRGQQRLSVLALRLGQIDYYLNEYKNKPILLLDDIFSELDPNHRQLVVDICSNFQTIFTSSEPDTSTLIPGSKIIEL